MSVNNCSGWFFLKFLTYKNSNLTMYMNNQFFYTLWIIYCAYIYESKFQLYNNHYNLTKIPKSSKIIFKVTENEITLNLVKKLLSIFHK